MEEAADLSEQYSRRNCVRISGVQEENNEDTDRMVQNMAYDLNVNLTLADIDRSNRVGKPRVGRQWPIMVKFATYRVRQVFIRNVWISETKTAGVMSSLMRT